MGGQCEQEKRVYLGDGLLLLNAPLSLHPLASPPLLFFPPPLCSRRRYEKVIMFPLEMARSPSAPFISKWNNLSTVAFFFFSLHLHLSFHYTTPAPLFPFSFLLPIFFFPHPSSLLPSDSLICFSPPPLSLLSFLVFGVECNQCGVRSMHYQTRCSHLNRYYVKQVLGVCMKRLFPSRMKAFLRNIFKEI